MKKRLQAYKEKSASQALVVVLLAVTLLSIIIVGFLLTASLQNSISHQDFQSQAARAMAVTGLNSAITQIRTALGPWDDPFKNFCGGIATSAPPTFYWSTSPGIITRWSYASTTPQTNYPLFSQSSYGDTNLANLNVPSSEGIYPIIGGANPPAIQVYWANVLQNPFFAPASTNRIIGRYAFWVDDESAKININTADGTLKYQTNSLGLGTPSEVSLQALQEGGANLSTNVATNIVFLARTTGFNSVPDILRATGTTPDLWTNNVFNLTTCSRSPDLNIFGQPKMALMPVLGDSSGNPYWTLPGTNMVASGITLQPATQIYPTPSQLPPYTIIDPVALTNCEEPWPLAFRQVLGLSTEGGDLYNNLDPGSREWDYTLPNSAYINGRMLAKYLSGTNAMGQTVTWPPFPGSSSAGFLGKYTPRQIDSVVAQIASLGGKDISPDFYFSADPLGRGASAMGGRGRSSITVPDLFTGWLSGQWVSGMGRVPKVDALLMEYNAWGSLGQTNNLSTYVAPRTTLDMWQEWWLPAGYLGDKNSIPISQYTGGIYLGGAGERYNINIADMPSDMNNTRLGNPPAPIPAFDWPPASIPKFISTNSPPEGPSYWANQLLNNNQGIDFSGDPNQLVDPDQGLAAQYHSPYAWRTNWQGATNSPPPAYAATGGMYSGNGGYANSWTVFMTPFLFPALQVGYPGHPWTPPPQDWSPGELRCLHNTWGTTDPEQASLLTLPMQTNADGGTLQIGGGIVIRSENFYLATSDLDPVPLDSVRGNTYGPGGDNTGWLGEIFDGESWTNSANIAGLPASATVRDLALAAVIPTSFSSRIPTNGDLLSYSTYVLAQVADPLVNKFPGDWNVTVTANAPTTTMQIDAATTSPTYTSSYSEYSYGFHANLADPDSYWMPQLDCGLSFLADLPTQTQIPRSARMPNIGYLQYLRTGIIPDDETLSYSPQPGQTPSQYQHGTPFRLLSYAPSTETANQETTRPESNPLGISQPYPDWALLDLLYVPSILAPYFGPYGYYDPNNNNQWTGYGNPSVLANYSTFGGSTPGRINPNGAAIYTTNTTIPLPGVSRTLPIQAVLQGLMVNQKLNPSPVTPSIPNPGLTNGTAVDAPTIALAIYTYLTNNGPLQMPAEICNVPEIAALRPSVNATRNDLVRQIVGSLTTQSNVFSVWTVGQTVMKNPLNTGYGIFEAGDTVLAETRLHFIVERYLDPGADGVIGNASSGGAGPDGIVGTYDDAVDPINHPFCPHYLYRVIAAVEIR